MGFRIYDDFLDGGDLEKGLEWEEFTLLERGDFRRLFMGGR